VLPAAAATYAAGTGLVVLVGWAVDLFSRTAIRTPYVSMKPNTAACFALAGASLWLHARARGRRSRILARACGVAVAVIGILTAAEYVLGIDLGIDQLLFRDLPGAGAHPGRMAPAAAATFMVLGGALAVAGADARRLSEAAQVLSVVVGFVGLLGLLGYLYAVPVLHRDLSYTMALPASVAFIACSVGVLALRPDLGLVAVIASESAGGSAARRLLPWVLAAPVVIGWATLEGQRAGLYDIHLGIAWMVFGSVVVFSIVVWANAYPLHRLEERYRALMEQANDAILVLNLDHRILEANRAAERLLGRPRVEIVGRHYDEFVVPEERPDAAARQEEFLMRGALRIERRRLTRADGTPVSVEVSGSVVRLPEPTVVVILHDTTERERSEKAVRGSEARLISVLDAALDAVIMMDEHGRVSSWNARAEVLFGWGRGEAVGRMLSELIIPPRYREAHTAGLERFLASGEGPVIGRRIELSALRRDGSEFPVELTVTALEEGGSFFFNAFVADITVRKHAEEALRAAQKRLQHVVSSSPAVLYSLKAEGDVLVPIWVSDNIERLSGYTAAEVAGPEWWADRLHPDDRERVMGQVPTLLYEGHVAREYRFRHKDGAFRWVRDEQILIGDAAGPRDVVGSWSDITARKETELRLQASEEQYRLLFDRHPHPMWVFDQESLAFLAVNDAAVRHYGYSREEFLAMTVKEIRPPEEVSDFLADHEQRRTDSDGSYLSPRTWKHRKKDGTVFEVEIATSPMILKGRRARLALVADVTEKRSLESQLLQSQKIESMGRLAGGVAHDFNNLLGVILGYGAMLRKRVAADPRLTKYVDDITKAAERAAGLTRQLLAFSRKQVLQPRILNLNTVVGETEKMLRRLIGEDVHLLTVFDERLGSVKADPGQMDQILMNLAVNARDAMPQGGRLTIETGNVALDQGYARQHPGVEPGAYVMLAVSDTGQGMSPEVQARAFEPFFTTKQPGKGTGLGLATVHGIVKQSGGHVWVYSEQGHGTTFKIYLPRTDAPTGEAESPPAPQELPRGTETILIVEDEASLRELVREYLEERGYSILEARNGAEALEMGVRHAGPVHLLVTDVIMPGMSGRELAERLCATRPATRVLYMSGYTDDAVVLRGVLVQDMAFLQKPFTGDALTRAVREVLDRVDTPSGLG
jgi:hypothetical protein